METLWLPAVSPQGLVGADSLGPAPPPPSRPALRCPFVARLRASVGSGFRGGWDWAGHRKTRHRVWFRTPHPVLPRCPPGQPGLKHTVPKAARGQGHAGSWGAPSSPPPPSDPSPGAGERVAAGGRAGFHGASAEGHTAAEAIPCRDGSPLRALSGGRGARGLIEQTHNLYLITTATARTWPPRQP